MTPIISMKPDTPIRKKRVMNIDIDEKPQRTVRVLTNNRSREKFIKTCEKTIRASDEYREYIKFIKNVMHMDKCYVNPAISASNGKKYSIELHHEPFTLFDLVDIEIMKCEAHNQPLDKFAICKAVMALHYDGLVGLIPLSKTQHQLIHNGKIFIPLQHVYQDFYKYYEQYAEIIEDEGCAHIKKKLDAKIQLSLRCTDVQSDCNNPEFVYIDVNGFSVPEVPDEWKDIMLKSRSDLAAEEAEKEKEEKKAKPKTEKEAKK